MASTTTFFGTRRTAKNFYEILEPVIEYHDDERHAYLQHVPEVYGSTVMANIDIIHKVERFTDFLFVIFE